MDFSNIRQSLENIDYSWTKPQTYLVFVPGLSLLIQKIQLASTLPLIDDANVTPQNMQEAAAKSRKFTDICKWHLRGSMIQMIAAVIATKVFVARLFPLIAIFAALAAFEMVDTISQGIKNKPTLYEFHPNGAIKSKTNASPINIF